MKPLLFVLLFVLWIIIGCDSDSTRFEKENEFVKQEEITSQEPDCVFDTSTYKFTTEALRKFDGNIKFTWDTATANALVPLKNNDTLVLHIGGCNHFSYFAEYRTDSSKFNDSAFVVQKCLWLAETFFDNGFDEEFSAFIKNGHFSARDNNNPGWITYRITDTSSEETNHVYDGFGAQMENGRTVIFILGYIN